MGGHPVGGGADIASLDFPWSEAMCVSVCETVKGDGGMRESRQTMATQSRRPKGSSRAGQPTGPSVKALEPYRGQWVAYAGRRILSAGKDLHLVLVTARGKLHGKEPKLMEVPSADYLLL